MIPKSEPNFQVLQQSLHNFSITQLHQQQQQQSSQQQQSVIQPQQLLTSSQSHNVQLLQQPITNSATTTIVPNRQQLTKQNNLQQQQQLNQQHCSSTVNTNISSSGPAASVSSNNFSIADQTTTGNNIISIASNQQKLNDKIIQKMVAEIPNTILNKYRQRLIVDEQPKSPSETPPTLASGNLLASPTNSSKNAANSKKLFFFCFLNYFDRLDISIVSFHLQ